MIVRGDFNAVGAMIFDWLIAAAMSELELERLPAKS
jgi:hypothetical protein